MKDDNGYGVPADVQGSILDLRCGSFKTGSRPCPRGDGRVLRTPLTQTPNEEPRESTDASGRDTVATSRSRRPVCHSYPSFAQEPAPVTDSHAARWRASRRRTRGIAPIFEVGGVAETAAHADTDSLVRGTASAPICQEHVFPSVPASAARVARVRVTA